MSQHSRLLSTSSEIRELAEALKGRDLIAFDTEFIRETTFYPIVEIIQIATDDESWLIDAQAFKKGYKAGPQGSYDPGLQPLFDILADKSILKIVHAAQGDQECLYTSFGQLASPTLDTAAAASLCGYGEAVGLGKLLKSVLDVTITKGHARTNWSVRPLPDHLAEYAHADVTHLVALGRALITKLDELGRKPWAMELSAKWEDKALFEPDFEGMAQKLARSGRLDKKGYAALIELTRWREDRVRQLNLPRRWVAEDTVLIDLAHVRPKDLAHLGTFRGLNKGELKNSGVAILEAIERGVSSAQDVTPPKAMKATIPTVEESQALDLLKCYVGILADKHRIAARHLLTSAQLAPLLRNAIETPEDLVAHKILSEDAAKLIGDDVIAMLKGKRALSVEISSKGLQIKVTEI